MSYPIALIFGIAAGREQDLLDVLPLAASSPGELEVEQPEGTYRFVYQSIVAEDGTDTINFAGLPSSGVDEKYHLYILQPDNDLRPVVAKELWTRLRAWADSNQPTNGKYHLLGPYTPARFQSLVPEPVWEAVLHSWWTVWRAEGSEAGMAAQLAYDDDALDSE